MRNTTSILQVVACFTYIENNYEGKSLIESSSAIAFEKKT